MEIPLSSAIAMNRIETEASDRREQQEMKKLVLDYEMREEQNEKKGSFPPIPPLLASFLHPPSLAV